MCVAFDINAIVVRVNLCGSRNLSESFSCQPELRRLLFSLLHAETSRRLPLSLRREKIKLVGSMNSLTIGNGKILHQYNNLELAL